jgi:hypothetical protein
VSILVPLSVIAFLVGMGWVLLRLIGSPDAPESFHPNACCSRRGKRVGRPAPQGQADRGPARAASGLQRFPVASGRYRPHIPR